MCKRISDTHGLAAYAEQRWLYTRLGAVTARHITVQLCTFFLRCLSAPVSNSAQVFEGALAARFWRSNSLVG